MDTLVKKQKQSLPNKSLWDFPSVFSGFDVFDYTPSGLSVSEDDQAVYVQVQVPGIDVQDIHVEYADGYLTVHAEKKEEKTEKKYYRKSQDVFSYALHVPGNINHHKEPKAELQKGILTISFVKEEEKQLASPVKVRQID